MKIDEIIIVCEDVYVLKNFFFYKLKDILLNLVDKFV